MICSCHELLGVSLRVRHVEEDVSRKAVDATPSRVLQRQASSIYDMTTAAKKEDAEPGTAAAQGSSTTAGLYLLLVVALLDERGPDGPGGNGIHTDAALNQMCC